MLVLWNANVFSYNFAHNYAWVNWAHISGRQTPGLTRGSSPRIRYIKGGLNPGVGVLRCGLSSVFSSVYFQFKYKLIWWET
jgi:hypothetical protein